MKKYGHTKTLFLQNGKYYKWSYKHNHCIICGTCNFKHKGNGLCTSCWDKERAKKGNRIKVRRKAGVNYYNKHCKINIKEERKIFKNKIFAFIPKTRDINKIHRDYYYRHLEALKLIAKATRLRKRGFPCMKIAINCKIRYLPFESLEKPTSTTSNMALYDEWKRKMNEFKILKKHYTRNRNDT